MHQVLTLHTNSTLSDDQVERLAELVHDHLGQGADDYRELLCSDYSVPPERVFVVPNPLDLQRFSADGRTRRSGPLTLLFVSRIAVRKGVKMPPEWLDSVIGSAKISKLGLPVIIPVAEFRDLVGAAVTATLSGADPATELKKAHEQFRPILERSEKA